MDSANAWQPLSVKHNIFLSVSSKCSANTLISSFPVFWQSVTSCGEMAIGALSITLRAPPSPHPPVQSVEVTRMIMKKLNKR